MVNTLIFVAVVFAGVSMLASLHTLVRFDKNEKTVENWAQSLSDDCNKALEYRSQIMLDAAKKDIIVFFEEYDKKITDKENDEKNELLSEDAESLE